MQGSKKGRPGTMIYFDWIPLVEQMTAEQTKDFILSSLLYARDGAQPDFQDQSLRLVWPLVKSKIDADEKRYTVVSKANSQKRRYGAYKAGRKKKGLDYMSFDDWCVTQDNDDCC